MTKRLLAIISVVLLLGLFLTSCLNTVGDDPLASDTLEESDTEATKKPAATENKKPAATNKPTPTYEKEIDIYIIAGQSNAAGYTKYNDVTIAQKWSKALTGTSTVLYTGRAEYTNNSGTPNVSTGVNEVKTWVNAKAGQGRSTSHMGVEVGMAKVLSEEYYTAGSGKTAGIIKFAHGGTSLLNNTGGENAASGNWVSPSYAKELGVSHSGLTGGLYRGLLKEVETKVALLKEQGYDKINIKGLFWMQGESDRGSIAAYDRAFKCFAKDIRSDLSLLMGENLSSMPIIIGEISETFGAADTSTVNSNNNFIAEQRKLATDIYNCYTIASSQYKINELQNGTSVAVGTDKYHWNEADMFNIGKLVGRCIVDSILK